MNLRSNKDGYGLIPIALHWFMAILIIGMYFLGDYMVDLDYYDPWYHRAPWWHSSIGVTVFLLLCLRWGVRLSSDVPEPLKTYKKWELKVAKITHGCFYVLLVLICISGYLVMTAKGVGVDVFSLFTVPALTSLSEGQAELVAEVHEITTSFLMILLLLHVAAAIKHHFFDRDTTLLRMLGRK